MARPRTGNAALILREIREGRSTAERVEQYYASQTDKNYLAPRVRMGLRLFVHCAVPSMKMAAEAVGLAPSYLSKMSRTPAGVEFMETAHAMIQQTALTTSALIDKLSRRAIEVIATQMEDASSEALRLKAAIDLADRGSETSKVQKHQVESFTLGSEDARLIAASMVSAAAVRKANSDLVHNNFDRVSLDDAEDTAPIVVPSPQLRLEP
jgi:hypothetical protein